MLVGFREKASSFITDMQFCEILHTGVGQQIIELRELLNGLSIKRSIPQIEIAVADNAICLIFRILCPLPSQDRNSLVEFAQKTGWWIQLQPQGLDSVHDLMPAADESPTAVASKRRLYYALPEWDLRLYFEPQDFIQVNPGLNRRMIAQAIRYLDLQPDDTVLDLFCGMGNLSLPIARTATAVIGIEGSATLVELAKANAEYNSINNAEFIHADLYATAPMADGLRDDVSKVLLDPPRSGAQAVMHWLPQLQVQRIVYISCNPATLARDAGILCGKYGFQLSHAGVMDMFPHTAHVEAMAVFEPT